MAKKRLKPVLTLLALIISPLIIGMMASVVSIAVHLANGESFSTAQQALASLFNEIDQKVPGRKTSANH